MIKPPNDTFEEFEFKAEHLNRYIEASGIFSILLKNGQIIHFIPKDVMSFKDITHPEDQEERS